METSKNTEPVSYNICFVYLFIIILLIATYFAVCKKLPDFLTSKSSEPLNWEITYTNTSEDSSRISIDELRKCKGFENYTDEEATRYLDNLENFSITMYQLYTTSLNHNNNG